MSFVGKTLIGFMVLLPLALPAQTLREQLAIAPEITFEEWRDMTAGQTVVYEIDGDTYAYEAYRLTSNGVYIKLEDGSCFEGTWYMEESAFCFDWEDTSLDCFHHKRLGDSLYVVGLEDGLETGEIQKISEIAPIPVQCGPALLSSFSAEATQ